jgi:predicted PurR-regulated permease PerM
MATKKIQVEINTKSILTIIGVALLAYFVYMIRDIIAMVFIAFIFSSAVSPIVNFLSSRKISKPLAVAIVYILTFIVLSLILSLIAVPLTREFIKLFNNLPNLLEDLAEQINNVYKNLGLGSEIIKVSNLENSVSNWTETFSQNLGEIVSAGASGISGIINVFSNLFGGIVKFLSVIVISIYISLDKDKFYDEIIVRVTDPKKAGKIRDFILKIESTLGNWLLGQGLLSIVIGILGLIAYSILQLPYVGALALLTGILNIIPNLGPIIAFVPVFILSLSTGDPLTIVGSIVASIAIQQLESQLVAPKILSTAVGLPPIFIILAILIGAQLFGVAGILLAVPIAVIVHLSLDFLSEN